MNKIDKVLYTALTHTTGGREGASQSSDGRLNVQLASPGSTRIGTNPEQMFAAGWSAFFMGAMGLAARKMKIALPSDASEGQRKWHQPCSIFARRTQPLRLA